MPFVASMHLEVITLSEVSQTEKAKQHMIYLYVESEEVIPKSLTYKTEADIENKLRVPKGKKLGLKARW